MRKPLTPRLNQRTPKNATDPRKWLLSRASSSVCSPRFHPRSRGPCTHCTLRWPSPPGLRGSFSWGPWGEGPVAPVRQGSCRSSSHGSLNSASHTVTPLLRPSHPDASEIGFPLPCSLPASTAPPARLPTAPPTGRGAVHPLGPLPGPLRSAPISPSRGDFSEHLM